MPTPVSEVTGELTIEAKENVEEGLVGEPVLVVDVFVGSLNHGREVSTDQRNEGIRS